MYVLNEINANGKDEELKTEENRFWNENMKFQIKKIYDKVEVEW